VHFPTLTVEQTIQFAATTRTPEVRLGGNTRKSFRIGMTDVLTTIFGLRHVKKTPVGDASIRGVSGGEKKRVSISEALATRSLITSWDKCVLPAVALLYSNLVIVLLAVSTLQLRWNSFAPCVLQLILSD
jgi:hypothetical protein